MGKKALNPRTYIFTLEDIDLRAINTKYSLPTVVKSEANCNGGDYKNNDASKANTTRLVDLNTEKGTPEVVSFLDESKRVIRATHR